MSKDDTQHNIGTILDGPKPRDAIHIAVYASKARRQLDAGQRVGIEPNGIWADDASEGSDVNLKPIGIVDPFLPRLHNYWDAGVEAGQWFYVWLIPNTITGLSHHWTHPDFPAQDHIPIDEQTQAVADALTGGSKTFLTEEADRAGLDLEDLLEYADGYVTRGEYASDGGRWEGFTIREEFWDHYTKYTGKPGPSGMDRCNFFTCKC